MKETTPWEISPDNDLGNYRGPYKWYCFLVLPFIELAYCRRIATFSGGLVLSYSHVFLLAPKESSKAPLNQTHFSQSLSVLCWIHVFSFPNVWHFPLPWCQILLTFFFFVIPLASVRFLPFSYKAPCLLSALLQWPPNSSLWNPQLPYTFPKA